MVLRAACVNPVLHYKLKVGLLQQGDPADFIEVDDLEQMNVLATWIDGEKVAENHKTLIPPSSPTCLNQFSRSRCSEQDFVVPAESENVRVIVAEDGQLITTSSIERVKVEDGNAVADPEHDLLKMRL